MHRRERATSLNFPWQPRTRARHGNAQRPPRPGARRPLCIAHKHTRDYESQQRESTKDHAPLATALHRQRHRPRNTKTHAMPQRSMTQSVAQGSKAQAKRRAGDRRACAGASHMGYGGALHESLETIERYLAPKLMKEKRATASGAWRRKAADSPTTAAVRET